MLTVSEFWAGLVIGIMLGSCITRWKANRDFDRFCEGMPTKDQVAQFKAEVAAFKANIERQKERLNIR